MEPGKWLAHPRQNNRYPADGTLIVPGTDDLLRHLLPRHERHVDATEPPALTAEEEWRMGQQEAMQGHLARLDRLAEIAMAMAETVGERAVKDPGEADVATFEKISQIVRKVIALRAHLGQGFLTEGKALIAERARARAEALVTHDVRKQTIIVDSNARAVGRDRPRPAEDAAAQ